MPTCSESIPSGTPSPPACAVASMANSISTEKSEPQTAATLSRSSEAGGSRSNREVIRASTEGGKSI